MMHAERLFALTERVRLPLVVLTLTVAFVSPSHAAPKPWLDDCHASQFVRFIGRPVAELEQMDLANARFLCTPNCAGTADVQSSRLTVIYSEKTKRIIKLRCE